MRVTGEKSVCFLLYRGSETPFLSTDACDAVQGEAAEASRRPRRTSRESLVDQESVIALTGLDLD